jgi:hypothetical protein
MAGSPQWKVYNDSGEYVAACKHAEDAAALVANYGSGAKIKHGHSLVVWHEGHEAESAGESYDACRIVMLNRLQDAYEAGHLKSYGKLPDGYVRPKFSSVG